MPLTHPVTSPLARARLVPLLLGLLLALLLALLVCSAPSAGARGKPGPTTPTTPTTPLAPKRVGLSTEGAPGGAELQALVAQLGRVPDEVMWFVAWSLQTGFPTEDAARVRSLGATPVITWEPWDPAGGTGQTTYSMRGIAAGQHDAYLRTWARGVKAFGTPVVLRFAHEANGTWYPWSPGVAGTTAADVVGAWQHVRDVFRREKATNAVFRWSPNVPFPGSTPMAQVWPGSSYVDQVGLDGYNWAGHLPSTTWTSFADVVRAGVAELGTLSTLPVHVSETASPETAPDGTGDKAAWIRDLFASLRADPRLAGVTWFSHRKELDWRVDSSPTSLEAFRVGWAGLAG